LNREITFCNGEIYVEKRSGSRTEPWGTPERQGVRREDDVPTEIYCERLDKYEVNQAKGEPATETTDDRMHPIFAWSTVSNAVVRSSARRYVTFFEPEAL